MTEEKYDSKNIKVIKDDMEAIRQKSAMYVGHCGIDVVYHLMRELIDNSVDEDTNNYIYVSWSSKQNKITVKDRGRGIPDDNLDTFVKLFTKIHSSGKFDKDSYDTSIGLHGVGLKLVNALSFNVDVVIYRNGENNIYRFKNSKFVNKETSTHNEKFTGTEITFSVNPKYIDVEKIELDSDVILSMLKNVAYFNDALRVAYNDIDNDKSGEFMFHSGLNQYVTDLINNDKLVIPVTDANFYVPDIGSVKVCMTIRETGEEILNGYTNTLHNVGGGTHVSNFKVSFTNAIKSLIPPTALSKHKITLSEVTGEYIRKGLVCVVAVTLKDPKFGSQSKDKLMNNNIQPLIQGAVDSLINKIDRNKIVNFIIDNIIKNKTKAIVKTDVKKQLNLMDTKLTDCYSKEVGATEIWILEGDSAAGSAKQGRDPLTQAILPLTGKPLNTVKLTTSAVLNNTVFKNMVNILGCGIGASFDITKLRYGKIILLTDKDPDGDHITVLLLAFFIKHLPELIKQNKVYLSNPPFYVVRVGDKKIYCNNDKEKDKTVAGLTNFQVSRFKGIGEMNYQELESTTMNVKKRKLTLVTATDLDDLLKDIY